MASEKLYQNTLSRWSNVEQLNLKLISQILIFIFCFNIALFNWRIKNSNHEQYSGFESRSKLFSAAFFSRHIDSFRSTSWTFLLQRTMPQESSQNSILESKVVLNFQFFDLRARSWTNNEHNIEIIKVKYYSFVKTLDWISLKGVTSTVRCRNCDLGHDFVS